MHFKVQSPQGQADSQRFICHRVYVSILSSTLGNAVERQHFLLNHAGDVKQCKFLDPCFPAGLCLCFLLELVMSDLLRSMFHQTVYYFNSQHKPDLWTHCSQPRYLIEILVINYYLLYMISHIIL